MVGAAALLQPGFLYLRRLPESYDPVTGEPVDGGTERILGHGLVQEPVWTSSKEVTPVSVADERLIIFRPDSGEVGALDVVSDEAFIDDRGRVWQCTTDGRARGVPGRPPEYIAVRVRRAKEKEK